MRGRDPAAQLVHALLSHAAGQALTVTHEGETPWASATFVGAQHRVSIGGAGTDTWLDGLDETELPLRRCFVASIDVARTAAGAMLTVLVIEE